MNAAGPQRVISLTTGISLIVGIIIGAGIYETSPLIAQSVPSAKALFAMWIAGGVISLCGALCYAELSSAYPEDGGDYAYLNRAFGPWSGFLFGWANFITIRPGSVAAVAFVFARYLKQIWHPLAGSLSAEAELAIYALAAVTILTVVNIAGVRSGSITQNVLTAAKVGGLVLIAAAGLTAAPAASLAPPAPAENNWGLALILILFCYGGWQEICYAAAEVREPKKNMLRALVGGTLLTAALYLLVSAAFLRCLGFAGLRSSTAVAADVLASTGAPGGGTFISLLICISALGALNGLILAGSRIFYVMGEHNDAFRFISKWNGRFQTPVRALLLQGLLSALVVLLAGSFTGAIVYTTTVVWAFFLLTGLALFVLRRKRPSDERPYRVDGYPVTPLIFCAASLYMAISAFLYDKAGTAVSLAVLLLGVPIYLFSRRRGQINPS